MLVTNGMASSHLRILILIIGLQHLSFGHVIEYYGRACQGQILELICPSGYSMTFSSVFFGRNDLDFCRGNDPSEANMTSCSLVQARDIVEDLCLNKGFCEILVDQSTFGDDPCPGTYKFLVVEFLCSEPEHLESTCAGDNLLLECAAPGVIEISRLVFGRDDSVTCSADGSIPRSNCSDPSSFDIISDLCNNKETCLVRVATSLLGHGCSGSNIHLQIFYTCSICENAHAGNAVDCATWADVGECLANPTWMRGFCYKSCSGCHATNDCLNLHENNDDCERWASIGDCISPDDVIATWMRTYCQRSCNYCPVPRPSLTPSAGTQSPYTRTTPVIPDNVLEKTVCEGNIEAITCDVGQGLRVYDVFFGRVDNITCPHASVKEVDCPTEVHRVGVMASTCEGRQYCHAPAYVDVFGDGCPGTYKYLHVAYNCQRCENHVGMDSLCETLSAGGSCDSNRAYMLEECFKTCTRCDVSECANLHGDDVMCDVWAMLGECAVNPNWMSYHCRQSCRLCSGEDARGTPTLPPATSSTTARAPPRRTEPVTRTACENQQVDLVCPMGHGVLLIDVFYGRQDSGICSGSPDDNTDCSDLTALQTLQRLCQAVSGCHITQIAAHLSDPCPGTSKYVNFTYQCAHYSEFTCAPPCGEHGLCISRDTCLCDSGYAGLDCAETCDDVSGCHGHGVCVGTNECRCDDGWGGAECDVADCSALSNCSGLGVCVRPNQCWCYPHRSGADCSLCFTAFIAGPACIPCPTCVHGQCQFTEGAARGSFLGCYQDDPRDRDLTVIAWTDNPHTSTLACMTRCHNMGYTYAGLQNGSSCFCGNSYGMHGASGSCREYCSAGEEGEVCGGRQASSVWKTTDGRCVCSGDNWSGDRCDMCSDGYGGPECTPLPTSVPARPVPATATPATPTIPSTTLPTPTIPSTTLPTPTIPSTTLPTPTIPSTTLPTPTIPSTTLPTPTIPSTTLPTPTIPSTTLPTRTEPAPISPLTQSTATATSAHPPETDAVSSPTQSTTKSSTAPSKPSITSASTDQDHINGVIVLSQEWKEVYSDLKNSETAVLVNDIESKLLGLYISRFPNVTDVHVMSLRKGSVVVDFDVYMTHLWADPQVIRQQSLCSVIESANGTGLFGEDEVLLQGDDVYFCTEMSTFCGESADLHMPTIDNSTWTCTCRNGSRGVRCMEHDLAITDLIIIISVCCVSPILIGLVVCCVIRSKAFQDPPKPIPRRTNGIPLHGVSIGHSLKSSQRKLFEKQKMKEYADNDGFFPAQI